MEISGLYLAQHCLSAFVCTSRDSKLWMRDLTEGAAYLPRVISHRMPAWQRRWEGTPMVKVVEDAATRVELAAGLDEIVREGARRMLAAALEAEVEAYLAAHAGERPGAGRRLVVRNGHARALQVTTVAGAVEVRVRGWTIGGSTRPPASGGGSAARCCRRGAAGRRR